jgi:hypothetical protein
VSAAAAVAAARRDTGLRRRGAPSNSPSSPSNTLTRPGPGESEQQGGGVSESAHGPECEVCEDMKHDLLVSEGSFRSTPREAESSDCTAPVLISRVSTMPITSIPADHGGSVLLALGYVCDRWGEVPEGGRCWEGRSPGPGLLVDDAQYHEDAEGPVRKGLSPARARGP